MRRGYWIVFNNISAANVFADLLQKYKAPKLSYL
jgi:hypothetical protein